MVSKKSHALIAAEWLVVGFVKCWTIQMLRLTIKQATGQALSEFRFLPCGNFWDGKAPVRGYVHQNFPKLNAFLNRATAEQQIKAAEQILKLRWNGNRPQGSLDKRERREVAAEKKDLRISTTSYNESRKIYKRHSLTNWRVCK